MIGRKSQRPWMCVSPEDHDWNTTEAMMCYGGGFVAALGQLYRLADPINQARLKTAFHDYWREYSDIARQQQAIQTMTNP